MPSPKQTRSRRPSRAVSRGAPIGTALGTVIDIGAAVLGAPLPPGTGALLGGSLATLFAFFVRGGRRGEAD